VMRVTMDDMTRMTRIGVAQRMQKLSSFAECIPGGDSAWRADQSLVN
jgi:hypothetical protein